jgi:hypothetical protein
MAALAAPTRILAEAVRPLWRQKSLQELGSGDFSRQLNTTFRIHATPGRSIEVKLDEVRVKRVKPLKPGQRPPGDAGNEKFSLFFVGRRSELFAQDTYTIEHDVLGQFDVFIVPIWTRHPATMDYQVVVNHPGNSAFKTQS